MLARLNRLLFDTTTDDRFVTVFYGVYDPETRTLTYANAGHCPPIVMPGLTRLHSLTPPAGMFAALLPAQNILTVSPGDSLVMFSDGLSEATNQAGEAFGEGRLIDVFHRLQGASAEALCHHMLSAVEDFSRGAQQVDDMTVIVLNCRS